MPSSSGMMPSSTSPTQLAASRVLAVLVDRNDDEAAWSIHRSVATSDAAVNRSEATIHTRPRALWSADPMMETGPGAAEGATDAVPASGLVSVSAMFVGTSGSATTCARAGGRATAAHAATTADGADTGPTLHAVAGPIGNLGPCPP